MKKFGNERNRDVEDAHLQTSLTKYHALDAQQKQLLDCLEYLLQEVTDKTRTFRIYHQFKMYNDPALNPELYLRE